MSKLNIFKLQRLRGAALESVLKAHDTFMTANVEFSGRKLVGKLAYLNKKNLDGADFRGRNLESVRFNYCSLRGADFTDANVRGAYFTGADLTGAKGFTEKMILNNVINTMFATLPEPFESALSSRLGRHALVLLPEWEGIDLASEREPNRPGKLSTRQAKRHER